MFPLPPQGSSHNEPLFLVRVIDLRSIGLESRSKSTVLAQHLQLTDETRDPEGFRELASHRASK